MSSDFSVKPVGAPVATAIAQPASPAHQSAAAADAAPRVRNDAHDASDDVSHQVILDRDAASIVYQVVDNRTSLVVRQFPDQAILRRRAYFRALDLMNDDARIRFTDRSA
jgi:uncharacterized FlaG/YvyC family protein